jgi:hypothetical protein
MSLPENPSAVSDPEKAVDLSVAGGRVHQWPCGLVAPYHHLQDDARFNLR